MGLEIREKRIHYVNERLAQLARATVMNKLDPNSRFWQILSAQAFCELITFIPPHLGATAFTWYSVSQVHIATLSENNEHNLQGGSRSMLAT